MEDLEQEKKDGAKGSTLSSVELSKKDLESFAPRIAELARHGANLVLPTLDILGLYIDNKSGDCKFVFTAGSNQEVAVLERTDGTREEKRADQTRSLIYPNNEKVEFDSTGHASSLVTADGVKREFSGWSLDTVTGKECPSSIKVTGFFHQTRNRLIQQLIEKLSGRKLYGIWPGRIGRSKVHIRPVMLLRCEARSFMKRHHISLK